MSDDPQYDLTLGMGQFLQGLRAMYPEMSPNEMEALGNAYLGQIGAAFSSGEAIGSVRVNEDGSFNLRLWNIDELGGGS